MAPLGIISVITITLVSYRHFLHASPLHHSLLNCLLWETFVSICAQHKNFNQKNKTNMMASVLAESIFTQMPHHTLICIAGEPPHINLKVSKRASDQPHHHTLSMGAPKRTPWPFPRFSNLLSTKWRSSQHSTPFPSHLPSRSCRQCSCWHLWSHQGNQSYAAHDMANHVW